MTDKPIDHEDRKGQKYDPKPVSDVLRKKRSEAMKDFNRKTGKVTQLGNTLVQRGRNSEGSKVMEPVDNDAFDEGFEQAYRAIKGSSAPLPKGPKRRWMLKDRTALQSGIVAGIAAATGLLAVDTSEIL